MSRYDVFIAHVEPLWQNGLLYIVSGVRFRVDKRFETAVRTIRRLVLYRQRPGRSARDPTHIFFRFGYV